MSVRMPMMSVMSAEDALLDERWRRMFGQPLPMLGAPEIARTILEQAQQAERLELAA